MSNQNHLIQYILKIQKFSEIKPYKIFNNLKYIPISKIIKIYNSRFSIFMGIISNK